MAPLIVNFGVTLKPPYRLASIMFSFLLVMPVGLVVVPPEPQVFRSSFRRSIAGFQLVPPPTGYVFDLVASAPSSPEA